MPGPRPADRKRDRAPELMRGKPSDADASRPALEGPNPKAREDIALAEASAENNDSAETRLLPLFP